MPRRVGQSPLGQILAAVIAVLVLITVVMAVRAIPGSIRPTLEPASISSSSSTGPP